MIFANISKTFIIKHCVMLPLRTSTPEGQLYLNKIPHFVSYNVNNVPILDTGVAYEGPVKLIQRVKIAHSFLQSVSNQFHFIILSLPM